MSKGRAREGLSQAMGACACGRGLRSGMSSMMELEEEVLALSMDAEEVEGLLLLDLERIWLVRGMGDRSGTNVRTDQSQSFQVQT